MFVTDTLLIRGLYRKHHKVVDKKKAGFHSMKKPGFLKTNSPYYEDCLEGNTFTYLAAGAAGAVGSAGAAGVTGAAGAAESAAGAAGAAAGGTAAASSTFLGSS